MCCYRQWEAYGTKAARNPKDLETLQRSSHLLEQAQQRFAPTPPVHPTICFTESISCFNPIYSVFFETKLTLSPALCTITTWRSGLSLRQSQIAPLQMQGARGQAWSIPAVTGGQAPGRTGRTPGTRSVLQPSGAGGAHRSAAGEEAAARLHPTAAELASSSRGSSLGQNGAEDGVLSEATNMLLGQVDSTRRKYAHEVEQLRVRSFIGLGNPLMTSAGADSADDVHVGKTHGMLRLLGTKFLPVFSSQHQMSLMLQACAKLHL